METSLTVKTSDIAIHLDNSVKMVIGNNAIGFEKAFVISSAISELKKLLKSEYMKPIMELQGQSNGFKTDKDKEGGYPEEVVKKCLIDAVLYGVQPYGNQFNIIAGNTYITKEGFGFLLATKIQGLQWSIIPSLPRINSDKSSAAVSMKIKYKLPGSNELEQDIEFPVKMNSYMGADGVIGKGTRKARAWLYNLLTSSELPEGDIETEGKVMSTLPLVTHESLSDLLKEKSHLIPDGQREHYSRILNNREEVSYQKMNKELNSL